MGNVGDAYGGVYAEGSVNASGATFAFKLLDNTISNSGDGAAGQSIGLRLDDTLPGNGIEVSGNTFTNHDIDIQVRSQAATTTVNGNKLDGGNVGVQNDDTSATLDATYNWWGDASGPGPVGQGSGDEVSEYVDYSPYYNCIEMTPECVEYDEPVYNVDQDIRYYTIQAAIDEAIDGDEITADPIAYPESVTINVNNLSLIGNLGSMPSITGGVALASGLTGFTLQNFELSGTVAGQNSVIRMFGPVIDLTIDNCVIDGENIADRHGLSGGQLEGDVTITNCEVKNVLAWSVLDSRSGSGGDGSAMGTVTFANNNVHHCNGSIVFRGLSTDRTDAVNAYGNTFNNIGDNNAEQGQQWAALEINRTVQANIYNNDVNGVAEGEYGEGQAFQLWDIDTLDVNNNKITNNFQGIMIYGLDEFPVPGGAIYCNTITGNTDFGIKVHPTVTAGTLNVENNWWGDVNGPSGDGGGSGDAVYGSVDFFPWLLSDDCGDIAPSSASDLVVNDDWVGKPDWATVDVDGTAYYIGLNAFDTIQKAIDAATDGNSISVANGNYAPFIIDGRNDLTISAGSNPVVQGVQSVTTSYGARDCVVFVKDSTNIVLNELDIQGLGLGTINAKNYGVIWQNSTGTISDCTVSPNTSGDMSSTAIGIWDGSVMTVEGSLLENFGRIGILVYNGTSVEILENEIAGQVYNGEGQVNYGIEVEGMSGTDDPATASQAIIRRNEIYNCDNTFDPAPTWGSAGVYVNGWLAYGAEADSAVTVEDNFIHDNYDGAYIAKSSASSVRFNTIVNNRNIGVFSGAASDDSTVDLDATYNFWGHESGPQDPNGTTETDGVTCHSVDVVKNADGQGDNVSEENAEYCPWLAVPVISSSSPCPVGDLDGDCDNDFLDFAIFAANWLKGT